jgi:hypothetical protein
MTALTRSFEKFNYLLRPSKQVERKLIVEALHVLRTVGYDVPSYTYLGFGSVYYADFVLFHKYLFIDDMVCAEIEPIPERMDFNKPYDFIKLYMEPIENVLPDVPREKRLLAWLDYDVILSPGVLRDLEILVGVVRPGSIVMVTVDAEARLPDKTLDKRTWGPDRRRLLVEHYQQFRDVLGRDIQESDVSAETIPQLIIDILRAAFERATSRRADVRHWQLFNFTYADGARMVTLGGVIDDEAAEGRLKGSGIFGKPFITRDRIPVEISVPPITSREKQWLDQNPESDVERPFEMDDGAIEAFYRYRRYYPMYVETLV